MFAEVPRIFDLRCQLPGEWDGHRPRAVPTFLARHADRGSQVMDICRKMVKCFVYEQESS